MIIKNETTFISQELLKQIDNSSDESIMWLLSAVNRLLINDKNTTLLEFSQMLKELFPEKASLFKKFRIEKNLKIIE